MSLIIVKKKNVYMSSIVVEKKNTHMREIQSFVHYNFFLKNLFFFLIKREKKTYIRIK